MDAVNPNHYKDFSNGAEVIDITENLTGNGAQAVQYIARSTRIDGHNKDNQIEDLNKAIWFCQREIERLGGDSSSEPLEFSVKDMDKFLLRMIGIVSGNAEVAGKIAERKEHPAYSDYELVLTFRKA